MMGQSLEHDDFFNVITEFEWSEDPKATV